MPTFIEPGDICIDIGANFGQYTYPLSGLVGPRGKVFSFEPLRYNFEILKNIVKRLKLTNVYIKNVALLDKNDEMKIFTPFDNLGIPNLGESFLCDIEEENKGMKKEKVKTVTLDNLMVSIPFNKISFIKCDVEGAELMVFRGGQKLLSVYHPTILCEIAKKHTKKYGYLPEALIKFLKTFGYKSFVFGPGGLVPVREVQDSHINYIFIYRDLANKYSKHKKSYHENRN